MAEKAYIALGSNLGKRQLALRAAIERIGKLFGTRVVKVATFRETAAVGGPEGQGAYINSAVEVETELGVRELMRELLRIEKELGRVRGEGEVRNGPRVIDLDILLYGELVVEEEGLVVPHPRMQERRFVLEPLAEIAREVVHPVLGVRVSELLRRLGA